MPHPFSRRDWVIAAAVALIAGFAIVYAINTHPTYLDAYYHASAANRMASGDGLTDTAIWIYLGLPSGLPEPIIEVPSHLYWMPATSILSGAFMSVFGVSYTAARIPMALCLAGAILVAVLAGGWTGGQRRHALVAGALMILSGSYADKWGEIDTFAPYALFGAGALAAMIYAHETGRLRGWLAAGVLSGAGHLTRADGLLLLLVGVLTLAWIGRSRRPANVGAFFAGYLLVMAPWFVRMYGVVGAPLPLGGLQTAFLREYLEIFTYPWRDIGIASAGIPALVQARIDALPQNLNTFFVSEGALFIWPFFLWGLLRAKSSIRLTVGLFALGLHAAMILVFAWPGANGGLYHGSAALVPWWAALTPVGIDALARAVTRRRANMFPFAAAVVTAIVIGIAGVFTLIRLQRVVSEPAIIAHLQPYVTAADRIMSNDPSRLYYHLGIGGAVLPYRPLDQLPEHARTFDIDYLLLEDIRQDGDSIRADVPPQFLPVLTDIPPYLELVEDFGSARLYRFVSPPGQ